MLSFILFFSFIGLILWMTLHLGLALLSVLIFFCVKLPIFFMLLAFGLLLCITIILIPLGIFCIKFAFNLLTF